MASGKQAQIITPKQEKKIVNAITLHRYPRRDHVLFLLSLKAGLRAKEISSLDWSMVTDADGMVKEWIELPDRASKGKGGRTIPMNSVLRGALEKLLTKRVGDGPIVTSERGGRMRPSSICTWFDRLYSSQGMRGCSSHSGRRTFITRAARNIIQVGGSLRDVQQLAGHRNLATTQAYIEGSSEAKRRVVEML